MTNKTLGQVAQAKHDAEMERLFYHGELTADEAEADAWEAAAQAVVDEVQSGLRELAKSLESDLDSIVDHPEDCDLDEARSLVFKLYDAIMDPEEVKP